MSIVSRDIIPVNATPRSAGAASLRQIARSRRIVLLILALVLMSLADLICTISYLTSVGMAEANPIARHMIAVGGIRQLVLYKAFTMTLSCGCIYFIRTRRGAELGAWACVAVLFMLMLHWIEYNEVMHSLGPHFSSISISGHSEYGDWVMIRE